MRIHRVFPDLQPWASADAGALALFSADRLVAARIEPVTRGREPAAFLDLAFSDGERSATIPLIYIDLAQLDIREVDPLVFPAAYAAILDDDRARALVDRLFADLELRSHRGGFRDEEVIAYGDMALFRAARTAGLFGAAPLARSVPAVAPAVYARRFARDARVVTYGPRAAEIASFLRGVAKETSAMSADPTMAAWYGVTAGLADEGSYDLGVGDGESPVRATTTVRTDAGAPGRSISVARPLPADLLLSFDPAEGPVVATFAVETAREPFRRPAVALEASRIGDSAGRITLVVRPDAALVPDADTDEAYAFAAYLRAEGFVPTIVSSVRALAESVPDLVHLFGVRPGGYGLQVAAWAEEHGVPLAVHAYFEDPAQLGYWGMKVAPYCFGYSADDRSVTSYLELLGRRAVEVDGVGATAPFAPPAVELADAERVLRTAQVVYVNSERERHIVERVRPASLTLVVPPLPPLGGPDESVGTLTGHDPFVLCHAPIGPAHNQLVLARTTADMGLALVLAGPVEDPGYAERVREFAAHTRSIGEPSPGLANVLYRTAAVVADVAWVARGHARVLQAAAAGAATIVSAARWVDLPLPDRWRVDPADTVSIARGLAGALDAASRNGTEIATACAAARERFAIAGMTVVAGYAKIVSGD